MTDLLNAFHFFSDHVHVAGWITLIVFAVKSSAKITRFFDNLNSALVKTEKMEGTVELMATNHLPHLQEVLNALLSEIRALRNDIFQIALKK